MDCTDIEILLRQSIGLDIASLGASTIERAVRQRVQACSLQDWKEYTSRVRVSEAELQALIEAVDQCLGEVVAAVHGGGGACIVTADHGNAEQMLEPDGSPNTAHSLNPVPFVVTVPGLGLESGGVLADVAPTVLDLLGIEVPSAMTGRSLVRR